MKSFYKNQNLNLISSMAQQIVFNNSKNGKLESTNTQDAIDEISNILDEEKTMISDAWNIETTYTVGQYCIYNNTLWKCKVQHSGQTPSEGTYWTKTQIDDEILSIKNDVSTINSNLVEIMSVERYGLNLRTIPTNTEVIMHTITPEKDIFINIKASIIFRDNSNIGVRSVTIKIDNTIYDEQQQGKNSSWTIINNVSYLGLLKAGSELTVVVWQNSGENVDVDGRISVNN